MQNQAAEFIATLIDGSFSGRGKDGVVRTGRARNFLHKILERFGAEGVVFWRLEGPNYIDSHGEFHRLVSGVSVFKQRKGMPERLEMRDLPICGTSSGAAFAEKRKIFGRVKGEGDSEYDLPFEFHENQCFKRREITWLLALPVVSPETDVFGVLSLYWGDDQKDHAKRSDHALFEIAIALWPGVYQRIRESRRLQLITAVDSILGQSRSSTSTLGGAASSLAPIPPDDADQIIGGICEKIGSLLHAEEVSIFLTPLDSAKHEWSCRASNWSPKPNRIYTKDSLPGITGWCLAQNEPIYIPDLHSFDKDKAWLDSVFTGNLSKQTWEDDLDLSAKDSDAKERPVRSFLAAPLVVDGVLLGVIRCTSKANSPLIYFSNPDRTSLQIVGTRIAQTWRNWQIAHSKNEEAKAWHCFNEQSREIPRILSDTIGQPFPDFSLLEASVLKACQCGLKKWGECAMQSPNPYPKDGWRFGATFHFKEAYPGASDSSPAPRGILEMAERQLDIYRTVSQLVKEVRTNASVLNRALSDLRHQIINPLNKALLRTNRHLKDFGRLNHVGLAVYPIRGLLRKSVNVANAFNMLVELEKTDRLKIKSSVLDPKRLYVLLTEVVRDARLDFDHSRKLNIILQENFKTPAEPDTGNEFNFAPRRTDLKIDYKLTEQILHSVIENAVKYSNSNNSILINVQLLNECLLIDISNRGARLLPEEAPRVVERNWRSPTAMKYVGEGTGIGLYLVDAIAVAHGGSFRMSPTDELGFTHAIFRLPSNNQTNESDTP